MNLNGGFCFGWGLLFWLSFSQKQEQEEPHNDIHYDEHGAEFWRFRKKHDCVDDKPETEKEDPKAFQKLLQPTTFYLSNITLEGHGLTKNDDMIQLFPGIN